MTIGATASRDTFNCNGASTVFPVPIQSYLATDFEVIHTTAAGVQATLVLNSDYSLVSSGTLAPPAWTLTTLATSPYPLGDTLQIFLNPVQTQQTSYVQGQAFPSAAVQANFDRLTQMVQRLQDEINRTIIAPDGDVSPAMSLPPALLRALTYLAFDVNGNVVAAAALPGTANTAASLGLILNPRTLAELTTGLAPVNLLYPVLDSRRYALDTTGATDVTTTLNLMLATAGVAATDGEPREVVLYPGTYLFRRLYINYSNVYLRIMPGAVLQQTLTGITNSQTTGTTPAYACIHINPLAYTVNPQSAVTAITNVQVYGGGTIQGPLKQASFTGTIAAFTLTVAGFVAGGTPLAVGTTITGVGVTASTTITSLGTGTGGNGTYGVSVSQAIGPIAMVGNPGYQQFILGVVSNDCNKCHVHDVLIQGFGGENVLHGPSAWNTCSDLRIYNLEVIGGGEVGINNARGSEIMRCNVHDSWTQNGVGADGDQIVVGYNRIRNMAGGGLTPGGSGAKDINASRDVLYIGNICTSTGQSIANTFAMFCSDDGAITVPKYNHRYIANTLNAHNGAVAMGCDYNTALNVEIENNTITNCISPGASGQDFNVIAGSGVYHLRGNTMNPGTIGNNAFGISNSSAGAPVVNIEEGNDISGHGTADINVGSTGIVLKCEYAFSLVLSLTGFASNLNCAVNGVVHGNKVTMNLSGTVGASTSTTCTLLTLPAYLRPTRNQNIITVVTSSNAPVLGFCQVAASGVITFFASVAGAGFVNDGLNKGITGPYNLEWIRN